MCMSGYLDAPGDWENPVPVYFLAVEPETTFEFAVGRRRSDTPDELLDLARQWLLGALCHLGAGAKTNAGYGAFKPVEGERPALVSPRHSTFEATLELVTPAFLAGANQQADDCDLRPATLRGLLRWWWRTMHAGFVDVETLRAMEAAIWGDTARGGAVRVTVERLRHVGPYECVGKKIGKNKKNQAVLENDLNFVQQQGLEPAPKFTTQGLFYASYGTDEMKTGDMGSRKRRWYLDAGSQWRIRVTAQTSNVEERDQHGRVVQTGHLPASLLVDQARTALWLLCHFGGVGSKSRKGFGSLVDLSELTGCSWDLVSEVADTFRNSWRTQALRYATGQSASPSLQNAERVSIPTTWTNPWFALDQIGASRQAFAQAPRSTGHGKHCAAKVALGLPRRIHGPLPFKLPHQDQHTPPEELQGPAGDRYAAPVCFHVGKTTAGLELRVLGFVPQRLWAVGHHDDRTGPIMAERTIQQLVVHLRTDLSNRVKRLGASGGTKTSVPSIPNVLGQRAGSGRVRVKVLSKHSLPNSFKVLEEQQGQKPGILQFGTPPAELPSVGDTIEVYKHNNDPRSPLYRWDPPPTQGPRPSQGRGGPQRRR